MTFPIHQRQFIVMFHEVLKYQTDAELFIGKKSSEKKEGSDYFLYVDNGEFDLVNGKVKGTESNNPDDSKWDYFREDMMIHVFHSQLHKIVEGYMETSQNQIFELHGRVFSLFFYTHQQFLRRANIELATNDLPEVVPLGIDSWNGPLGPGLKAGKH